MRRHPLHFVTILMLAAAAIGISSSTARAQFIMRPSLGLQTMWFNGEYPISQPISPGTNRDLPLGGGMMSSNNGVRLQLELIPDPEGIIRIPLALEYYNMSGKTTFSASPPSEIRKRRWLFRHDASLMSVGLGVTANFFTFPSLYIGAEGKFNYIPATELYSRIYVVESDSTVIERTVSPSPEAQSRIGLFLKLGTQLDFFEPFLLDVSLGYGALNLALKETDPAKQRNLLIVDSTRRDPELTVGYIGIGFSLIWKM